MIRTLLSIAAATLVAIAQPHTTWAQQKGNSRSTAKPAANAIVNLNTASAAELENLPGIGAKTAARIVEYRQKNGPFKKVEELMNVRGVGEKNFLKIKGQLVVSAPKADHPPQL